MRDLQRLKDRGYTTQLAAVQATVHVANPDGYQALAVALTPRTDRDSPHSPHQRQRRRPRRPSATPAHRNRLAPRRRARPEANRPGRRQRCGPATRERRDAALAADHPRTRRTSGRPRPSPRRRRRPGPSAALPQRPGLDLTPLRPPLDTPRHSTLLITAQSISTHWLRHTTLTRVERNFGYGIARAYAGHTDKTGPATTTYIRADLQAVATALATLTSQPHPLAASREDLGRRILRWPTKRTPRPTVQGPVTPSVRRVGMGTPRHGPLSVQQTRVR